MGDPTRRWLRPGSVVAVGDQVWVVDDVQPVAVVLDAESGEVVRTVGWSQLPPPLTEVDDEGWRVRAAVDGVWVQRSRGPLVLVGADGSVDGRRSGGLRLSTVTGHGAWCVDDPPVQDLATTQDAPPQHQGGHRRLLVAHPDRTTVEVLVDAPVHTALSQDGDLLLEVGTGAGRRRNLDTPDCWELLPETAWLRLPAAEPPPVQLSLSTHAADPPARRSPDTPGGGRGTAMGWVGPAGEVDPRWGPQIEAPAPGDLDWRLGWVGRGVERRVQAVGCTAGTTVERQRVDLGDGSLRAVVAARGWLWLAVEQRRPYLTCTSPSPVALLRMRADTGDVETVLAAGSVDVTDRCWPLPAAPLDAADRTAYWRDKFADLDHYWTRADGTTAPVAVGFSRGRVEAVGGWPDTCLHLTFDHTAKPGQRLRRVVPVFDELGRPAFLDYVPIHLMETLETGGAARAVRHDDGHLDV